MKRKVEPPKSRRDKALANRRNMLRSAYKLFCAQGYVGTTMSQIAEGAEVAVQTLYFTFNTKHAILKETIGASIVGFDAWDPRLEALLASEPRKATIELHSWFPAFEAAKTATAALTVFVDASLVILESAGPLIVAMSAAIGSDPDVEITARESEQRRVEDYAYAIDSLAKRGTLRKNLSAEKATDILLTIVSAETYLFLTGRRGWSRDDCRAWFLETLQHQLLAKSPSR